MSGWQSYSKFDPNEIHSYLRKNLGLSWLPPDLCCLAIIGHYFQAWNLLQTSDSESFDWEACARRCPYFARYSPFAPYVLSYWTDRLGWGSNHQVNACCCADFLGLKNDRPKFWHSNRSPYFDLKDAAKFLNFGQNQDSFAHLDCLIGSCVCAILLVAPRRSTFLNSPF